MLFTVAKNLKTTQMPINKRANEYIMKKKKNRFMEYYIAVKSKRIIKTHSDTYH